MTFEYDKNAALAAVLFLAHRVERADFHRIFKLMYFADKYHLERFGRLIASDTYIAMKEGPVPSTTYDIFKHLRRNKGFLSEDTVKAFRESIQVYEHHHIRPKVEPDLAQLSDSDIEALTYSLSEYGHKSHEELVELSHDDAWRSATPNYDITVTGIAKTLPNRDHLLEYLHDPHPG